MSFSCKLAIGFSTVLVLSILIAIAGWVGMDTAITRQHNLFITTTALRELIHTLALEEQAFRDTDNPLHSQAAFAALDRISAAYRDLPQVAESPTTGRAERAITTYKESFDRYVRQAVDIQAIRSRMLRESERLAINTEALNQLGGDPTGLTQQITAVRLAEKAYMLEQNTSAPEIMKDDIDAIKKNCERIQKDSMNEALKLRVFRISSIATAFQRTFLNYVTALEKQQSAYQSMQLASTQFRSELEQYIDEESTTVLNRIHWLQTLLACGSALAVALGIAATAVLSRLIARPLRELRRSSERFVNGDLDARVSVNTSDDIGLLALSFNTLGARLKKAFAELEDKNESLETTLAALQQSEARYKSLFEFNSDAIMVIDESFTIVKMNQASIQLLGGGQEEDFSGKNVVALSASVQADGRSSSDAARSYLADAKANGTAIFEWQHRRLDGTEFPGTVLLTHIQIDETEYYLGCVRDISERKRNENQLLQYREHLEDLVHERTEALLKAQTKLRHAEKMQAIGQLAGGVAHDFNNNLGGIIGCAELLERQLTDAKQRELITMIIQVACRSADLVEKLLFFARKGKILSVPVNVHELIGDATKLMQHSIDKRIAIKQHLTANPSFVNGDPSQLQSAILNIGINARDAMPDGGVFTIRTCTETITSVHGTPIALGRGQYVVIHLQDSGIGMSAEIQQRIFEPFYTTKPVGKGTGMGLSAAYGTIQNHGGTIQVKSSPGEGSTFSIWLPALREFKADEKTIDLPVATCMQRRILVVDDDDAIRISTRDMLQELGYNVITASNGSDAISYFKTHAPTIDLVLLDMVMPEMSGRDAFLAMKAIAPAVKVVLVSGYSIDGEAQTILAQGVLSFIQKPFRRAKLAAVVAENLL